MEWLYSLFIEHSALQAVVVLSLISAIGLGLGKIHICGISLGVTFVFFAGILAGHFGLSVDAQMLNYAESFGLIIFVYALGLQVGPGFFSSFRKGGVTLNMLALAVVLLGTLLTVICSYTTGVSLPNMVGILCGATTNTPALGAAQQTLKQMGMESSTPALGCAVAYPLGVIGIILAILSIRYIFKISFEKETEAAQNETEARAARATHVSLLVKNPSLFGKEISEIASLIEKKFVISRVLRVDKRIEVATPRTRLFEGDKLFVIAATQDLNAVIAFIGERLDMHRAEWEKIDDKLVSRRIMVTRSSINGKMLGQLHLRSGYGVNVTRVNRAGVDLVAEPGLELQVGDRVTIVGREEDLASVERVLGNSMRRLREPNLVPIFLGIALGILLGSIPFMFPGVPQPVKLGLAGGPLIIAILIGRFGPHYKLVTYTTMSANLMLREVGIALFLACVGLNAGEGFVDTVVNGGGYAWIGYGFIITFVPLLLIGIVARAVYKINYFTIMGLIAGSTTDPPALAYSNNVSGNDMPSVGYATVYPLTMFLRVLTAQLLVLFLA